MSEIDKMAIAMQEILAGYGINPGSVNTTRDDIWFTDAKTNKAFVFSLAPLPEPLDYDDDALKGILGSPYEDSGI